LDEDEESAPKRAATAGDFKWSDLRHVTERDPHQVAELQSVSGLELAWPLLRSLVGQSPLDFLVRTAALRALTSRARAYLSNDEVDRALSWLKPEEKDSVLGALRDRHWMEYHPEHGWAITTEGTLVLEVMGLLQKHVSDIDLFTSVTALEVAQEWSLPIHPFLNLMHHRLARLRVEIEDARRTRSPFILRRTKGKILLALDHSDMVIRALGSIPREDEESLKISRQIHFLLSALHDASTRLEADITTTGRQYITLPEGYSLEQVTRSLMEMDKSELAEASRAALRAAYVPAPQINAHALIFAAEAYLTRERFELPTIDWAEPDPPEAAPREDDATMETIGFVEELELLAATHGTTSLSELVPRGSPAESFLRQSLLGFLNEERETEGIAARIGNLPLEVTLADEGWPEPLEGKPLSRLSRGTLRRRPS